MAENIKRSPTFLVGTDKQRGILDEFRRHEQHFTEEYQKNKPLCFTARSFQQTHPAKVRMGYKDADATLTSPMLLGVCDGVSQLEEFKMDPSLLPNELLKTCEELAMTQLMPDMQVTPHDAYRGPISLLKEAYEATTSFGSTTVLLAALDNGTKIHGKLHPMIAVLSIGDCELLMLRRTNGRQGELEAVFHTEMQRIDFNVQTPLQLARVDGRIDEDFEESIALEVIEKGSAVHCVSAYEGDILVLGSDGVFDNLFLDEIVEICNEILRPSKKSDFEPSSPALLSQVAQRIVKDSHAKSGHGAGGQFLDTPIGKGGKVDDTSVVVAEIVELTEAHKQIWQQVRRTRRWKSVLSCGGMQCGAERAPCVSCEHDDDDERRSPPRSQRTRGEESDSDGSTEEGSKCTIA
uniref:Protein phosphatase n=1 Tax=Alexandrium catenella TaxID=2925 RepID=A0A7S1L516_ALECA|eukprot:CAMPEP_0171185034 /NCGR_PEP_ID=MMETSP0790-20130122/16089_1 /TAXON_ID=2925 /ORGANISM="Alexandrium catenella, Strain OF101" /LENGTH=405 /DNA_ID=CAMNT_0011650035 /DNA_START=63 /DNA_END=1280 /DNA_ORIENTATION=-